VWLWQSPVMKWPKCHHFLMFQCSLIVTQTHISSQNIPEDNVNEDKSEEMFVQECQNICAAM
jgi:hypothetical protein